MLSFNRKFWMGVVSAVSLLAATFSFTPAATAAPVTQTTANGQLYVSRHVPQTGEVKVGPGEVVKVEVDISNEGNPFTTDGTKALTFAGGPVSSGLGVSSPTSRWISYGCTPDTVYTAQMVPCAGATGWFVARTWEFTNTTANEVTVDAAPSHFQVLYGGTDTNFQANVSAYRTFNPGAAAPVFSKTRGDSHGSIGFQICFDPTKVNDADQLTVVLSAQIGTTTLLDTNDQLNSYAIWRINGSTLTNNGNYAYSASNASPTLSISFENIVDGTLTYSFDLQKNGDSVLKSCNSGGGGNNQVAYPGPIAKGKSDTGAPTLGTLVTKNFNADSNLSDPYSPQTVPDGNGNVLLASPSVADSTKTIITRLTPAGADSNFGTAGKVTIDTGNGWLSGLGWYGTKKEKLVAITGDPGDVNSPPTYKVHYFTNSKGSTVSSKTLTLSGICPLGFEAVGTAGISPVMSATAQAIIYCNKMAGEGRTFSVVNIPAATSASSVAAKLLVAFGDPGAGKCKDFSAGYDSDAKGKEVASIFYVSTSSTCMGRGTQSSTSLITVPLSGAASKPLAIKNPWAPSVPARVALGAGTAPGTWIATAVQYSQTGPKMLYPATIDAKGKFAIIKKAIKPNSKSGTYNYGQLFPVKQLSASKWLVERTGVANTLSRISIATLDIKTGALTSAQSIDWTESGNTWAPRNMKFISYSSTKATYFSAISGTQYMAGTWTLPKK